MSSDHRYRILGADDPHELEAKVSLWLSEGWVLAGGVAYSRSERRDGDGYIEVTEMFVQAVYWPHASEPRAVD